MKAQPYRTEGVSRIPCEPTEADCLRLTLPKGIGHGRPGDIWLPVQIKGTREGTGNWTWNGSTESPTLRQSVLHDFRKHDPEGMVNHIWITDGQCIYLPDYTHPFAGQALPLCEVE